MTAKHSPAKAEEQRVSPGSVLLIPPEFRFVVWFENWKIRLIRSIFDVFRNLETWVLKRNNTLLTFLFVIFSRQLEDQFWYPDNFDFLSNLKRRLIFAPSWSVLCANQLLSSTAGHQGSKSEVFFIFKLTSSNLMRKNTASCKFSSGLEFWRKLEYISFEKCRRIAVEMERVLAQARKSKKSLNRALPRTCRAIFFKAWEKP